LERAAHVLFPLLCPTLRKGRLPNRLSFSRPGICLGAVHPAGLHMERRPTARLKSRTVPTKVPTVAWPFSTLGRTSPYF
jgi:hypothetical protein